ncbi:MAG TPA: hypothetical protein VM390_12775 [Acidimicrobiales bacterium]|nr:hypothetical protein [Acidimicrobiales bacterium]
MTAQGDQHLASYLTDHLAGSTAGLNLARQIGDESEGTPLGEFMAGLAADIEADRKVLEDLLEGLAIDRSPLKQAATWTAEKLSRLRFNRLTLGSRELELLMELETLWMGVQGKLSLWESLDELKAVDDRLADLDTATLIERAASQAEGLRVRRRALAPLAFGTPPTT